MIWKCKKSIHQNKISYWYPKSSKFQEGDFSQRDFSNEYVPLILNWISKFGVENIPEKILEVHQTIEILHTVCDEMYKNIKKILKYTKY